MDDLPLPVAQEQRKNGQTSHWVRRSPAKSRRWEFPGVWGGLRQTGGFCVLQSFGRVPKDGNGTVPVESGGWPAARNGAADAGRRRPLRSGSTPPLEMEKSRFLGLWFVSTAKRTGGASPTSPPSKWVLSRVQKVDRRGKPANAHRPLGASSFSRFRSWDSAMDPGSRQQAPNIGLISNDPGARHQT